jgi:hypothetical protein
MQALILAIRENRFNELPSLQKEFMNIESIDQYAKEISQVQVKSSAIMTSIKSQIEAVFNSIKLDFNPEKIT